MLKRFGWCISMMYEEINMQDICSLEEIEMGVRHAAMETLFRLRERILPIFVSHMETLDVGEVREPTRHKLEEAQLQWNRFMEEDGRLENMLGAEVFPGKNIFSSEEEIAAQVREIRKIASKIQTGVRMLGEDLVKKIAAIQSLCFYQKYSQFDDMYHAVCEFAFGILFINPNELSVEMSNYIDTAAFKLYKCLSGCEKMQDKKVALEKKWIPSSKFAHLKSLFKNCLFSIFEYTMTYKLITKETTEQNSLLRGMEFFREMCEEVVCSLQPVIGSVVEVHFAKYNEYSMDKKILHHEISIMRKRQHVDEVLKKSKAIITEINSLNWSVGREAKNVINMEKACGDQRDLSIKRLFFLFEEIEKNLKKIEGTVYTYSKLVSSVKKAPLSDSKLFSIKSLDFRHTLLEGDLKSFESNLYIIYQTSKTIYSSNSKDPFRQE
ncbi:hypothetical protein NECID01_0919 [Nematocida sp. AWRm77]|nr:hypothetical protein NECID01_0919 [Nematocida sp. AWRm77]